LSRPLGQYHKYSPLTPNELFRKLDKVQKLFDEYAKISACGDVLCRREVLFDVIERVEKRRVYFYIFHGITMSERNEISLYCFWILKLVPFFNSQNPNHNVNVGFAVYLFLRMISQSERIIRRGARADSKYVHNLAYAFLYRDISKEAIMLAADTLLA